MLDNYNKAFESRIRLGVMSILMVNESADFSTLKSLLEVTDGNLASHLKALEDNEYVSVNKQFIGRKPNTNYKVTPLGIEAFNKHLKALESLLK
jgi:DNA-binding HxlR family transcriptional regulator